jgi:hypothetical protein
MRTLLLCALLAASAHAHAWDQAPGSGRRGANTWAARSSTGLTLGGTWTATEDPKAGTVTGTWTLLNGQGRTTASGAWSAAKSPTGWTGNWRAAAAGRPGEYTGTWTAAVDIKGGAGFAELFASAAQSAVSGSWRAGRQSGAWTIQVSK